MPTASRPGWNAPAAPRRLPRLRQHRESGRRPERVLNEKGDSNGASFVVGDFADAGRPGHVGANLVFALVVAPKSRRANTRFAPTKRFPTLVRSYLQINLNLLERRAHRPERATMN